MYRPGQVRAQRRHAGLDDENKKYLGLQGRYKYGLRICVGLAGLQYFVYLTQSCVSSLRSHLELGYTFFGPLDLSTKNSRTRPGRSAR